jgi:hypothetical protein
VCFRDQEFAAEQLSAPFFISGATRKELALIRKAGYIHVQYPKSPMREGGKLLASPAIRETLRHAKWKRGFATACACVRFLAQGTCSHLRREDPVFAARTAQSLHGAVLWAEGAFLLRLSGTRSGERPRQMSVEPGDRLLVAMAEPF